MKRFFIMASAAAALMASAQFFIPGNQRQEMPQLPPDQKLRYAEKVIETYYVDSVNSDKVVTEAINAMLKTLDPHSSYSDPEETRELTIPLEGNFSGIGITFNMKLTFCARLSLYLYFTYIKRLGPGLTSDKESMSCIRLRLWLQLRRRMRAMSF